LSFWVLLQVIVNIVLVAAVIGLWIRLQKPAKDDPRLSRGLQLLQSKISVLEDLSDRTETQVNQLTSLMEHKVKEIQQQILRADKAIQKIDVSMGKSMEVAKIFQDRIPHKEIIERQQTIKYVKAARMAHAGSTPEEIAREVDLSIGEIEFVSKVNRDQLQFSEEDLPAWATEGDSQTVDDNNQTTPLTSSQRMTSDAFGSQIEPQMLAKSEDILKVPNVNLSLSELGNRFRQAVQSSTTPPPPQPEPEIRASTSDGKTVSVKKVVFPRVNVNNNLS
jgi:hypothetical protein